MKIIELTTAYLLLILFLCSCSNKEEPNKENIISMQQEDEKINVFINSFKEEYPDISIIREDEYNLEDGTYVYVFLYSNPIDHKNISTTNICFVTETGMNAVDVAGGDLNFKFVENENSFKVLERPNRISIRLSNLNDGKVYDYQVTYLIEGVDALIKIESKVTE